jgi:UDP-N-acetylglucosamine--N-acetylmuramyl-(pentapeptide) pyrophosphoryl-undecaprenol N-acetylglucosamine transferase
MLPSSHQVKNAEALAKKQAALVINDDEVAQNPQLLLDAVLGLLNNEAKRAELSKNLHKFAKPQAAQNLARLIVESARR